MNLGQNMGGQFYRSGKPTGFEYEKQSDNLRENKDYRNANKKQKEVDDDLVIEENTIYEIDRDCFEKLKRQKKRKE